MEGRRLSWPGCLVMYQDTLSAYAGINCAGWHSVTVYWDQIVTMPLNVTMITLSSDVHVFSWLVVRTCLASQIEVFILTTSMLSGCSVNSASITMTRCWHRPEPAKCLLYSRFVDETLLSCHNYMNSTECCIHFWSKFYTFKIFVLSSTVTDRAYLCM